MEWKNGSYEQFNFAGGIGILDKESIDKITKYCNDVKRFDKKLWMDFSSKVFMYTIQQHSQACKSPMNVEIPTFFL